MHPKGSKQGGNFRWLLYAGGALVGVWLLWFSDVARHYISPPGPFDHMFSHHNETFHYKDSKALLHGTARGLNPWRSVQIPWPLQTDPPPLSAYRMFVLYLSCLCATSISLSCCVCACMVPASQKLTLVSLCVYVCMCVCAPTPAPQSVTCPSCLAPCQSPSRSRPLSCPSAQY